MKSKRLLLPLVRKFTEIIAASSVKARYVNPPPCPKHFTVFHHLKFDGRRVSNVFS
jgi:hypothetical protein